MCLPDEAAVKLSIRRSLSRELAHCRELLQLGLATPDPAIIKRRRLTGDTVTVVLGLFVKACLSYRAIIHLCEAGLDRSAAPLSRSLLETYLNLTFLVRRRITLYTFCNGTKKPLDLFERKLDTQFRTDLYCAYCVLRDEMMVGQWPKTPGLKRTGKAAHQKLSAIPSLHLATLGEQWKKRLGKRPPTCVGLHIADFAGSLGRSFYVLYRSAYAVDSQSVHQSDALDYLDISDTADTIAPRWHSSIGDVRWKLRLSSMMFLGCVEELQKRFHFGQDINRRIHERAADLRSWPQR
jgi:hypothetical protein